jgi:hypothetical protein
MWLWVRSWLNLYLFTGNGTNRKGSMFVFRVEAPFSIHGISQMGIYAGLGVTQALASFVMGGAFALLTYFASQQLHKVS